MNSRLRYLAEPELRFRFFQSLPYPRDGLYLFGPIDAQDQPRQVRYGVIGTPMSVSCLKEWAAQVSGFIDVPPPGRMSKEIEAHHVAFPGFNEAFFASWQAEPARVIDDITEPELREAMRIANRHEAIKAAVTIFVDRLIAQRKRDEDPPGFWYVVIPEFIYALGRPRSTVPKAESDLPDFFGPLISGKMALLSKRRADEKEPI